MDITLQFSTLAEAVNRSLAITAKRLRNADGKSVYDDITLSTAEQPLLYDYFREAIVLLNTTTQHFITDTLFSDEMETPSVTLTFPNNHNNAMNTTITVALTSFCVAYAVYAWLSVVNPGIVKRYEEAMQEKLDALVQLIFHKAPPQSSYTYDLPPVVNTPGDITLSSGGQYLLGYTLGSDGVDDLVATSSSEAIVVTKVPNNRIFSIYNGNVGETNITGTVTIKRNGADDNLAVINVTAKAPAAEATPVTHPVLLGYNALSDYIVLPVGTTRSIEYRGTITGFGTSNQNVSIENRSPYLNITASTAGTSTITIYDNTGWRYTLYVTVEAVQSTLPRITSPTYVTMQAGGTCEINYELGSDGIDDLQASITRVRPEGAITVTKDASNHKFVVAASDAGGAIISITSGRHQEANTTVTIAIHAAAQTLSPSIYGYENGSTINTVIGANPIRIYFYQGSTGALTITTSSSGYVSLDVGDDYVDVTPLAAGNITLTFANETMEFSQTLTLAIIERPAVGTAPVIYWPNSLALSENAVVSTEVEYVLGNDGRDNLVVQSSDSSVVSVSKDSTNHLIVLQPHNAGVATIHISDAVHGIDRYETVVVSWVEPELISVKDDDELTLPEVYEPASGFDASNPNTNPTIGTNGLAIEFKAASSGTYSFNVYPSSRAVCRLETIQNTGGSYTKKLVVFALEEGISYITVICQGAENSWSARFILRVGQAAADAPVSAFTANPYVGGFTVGGLSRSISFSGGLVVSAQSSNPSIVSATVTSTSTISVTPVGAGSADVMVTDNYGRTTTLYFQVNAAQQSSPVEISNSAPDGLYYLKGTVGSVGRITNPVFSLLNGTITLFTDSNGAATYVYDETTGEVTASLSVGSTNLEYAIWSIYYTLLSYVSGASFNRQTSVGTPSGIPTHFINKVTPTLNGSTSRNVVINDYNTISVNNDAVHSALSSDDSIASVEADVGSAFVTALATGTATITIVTLTGAQFTITYTVTATLLPSIDGNTSRSLTVGNTDTISVNNGTISSVSVSPSSGTLTANLSNGSVVVTGVGAGSATVTITTTDNTTLTVTYTVSAAASNTITAYNGQRNVFAYLDKTVTIDASVPVTVENPIVYIDNDGYVYAVSDNSNYILKYNTSSNQVEQGPYYSRSQQIPSIIICDAAVADYGTLVEKNNDYRKYIDSSNVLVLYSISSSQGQGPNPEGNAGGA